MDDEDERPDFGTVAEPVPLLEDLIALLIDSTDSVQPWWGLDGDHPQGYRGLWGARASRALRRSSSTPC